MSFACQSSKVVAIRSNKEFNDTAPLRARLGARVAARRTAVTVCEAESSSESKESSSGVDFMTVLTGEVDVTALAPYKQYISPVVGSELFKTSTGFTEVAELVNCRAAMIGALAGLGAEIFGKGPFLSQFASVSPTVLVLLTLITGASVYSKFKDFDGEAALKTLDLGLEDTFTKTTELANGRLAMLALAVLITVESVKGSALL